MSVLAATSPDYPSVARGCADLTELADAVIPCCACPRLVAWRSYVAEHPAPGFTSADYWSKPLPGFGDPHAPIIVIGLAPGAHGSNRTSRMFTGDKSGDYLFGSLFRVGLASAPVAISADDGLLLTAVRLTAPVRCVPPENRPTAEERRRCGPFLEREFELVKPQVVVALGGFGWNAVCLTLAEQGWAIPKPRPKFSHGAEVQMTRLDGRAVTQSIRGERADIADASYQFRGSSATSSPVETLERPDGADPQTITLLGCYHPSPHNTYTGRLTPEMLDTVFTRAKQLAGLTHSG